MLKLVFKFVISIKAKIIYDFTYNIESTFVDF